MLDFLRSMHDGRMIPASQNLTDLFIGSSVFLAEIHNDLPRIDDACSTLISADVVRTDMKMLRNHFNNQIRRDLPVFSR